MSPTDRKVSSTPIVSDSESQPMRDRSPVSQPIRDLIPPADDEPSEAGVAVSPAPGVLSGGEPVSLPPPMPELLSLKDRKFSHLSQEVDKMMAISDIMAISDKRKAKSGKTKAKSKPPMVAMSIETFVSITSQVSQKVT